MSFFAKIRASRKRSPGSHDAAQAECQLLEERRLLSNGLKPAGSAWWPEDYPQYYFRTYCSTCPPATTAHPITYHDGQPRLDDSDLMSGGFGTAWGHTRTWSAGLLSATNGNRWGVVERPHLLRGPYNSGSDPNSTSDDTTFVIAVQSGLQQIWFDYANDALTARLGLKQSLAHTDAAGSDPGYFTMTDPNGGKTTYFDFEQSKALSGQFRSYTDPGGNTTNATYFTTADSAQTGYFLDKLWKTTRTNGTTTESFVYEYDSAGRIAKVHWKHGSTTVRSAEYTYYGTGETGGNLGDLKLVAIKDGAGATIDEKYYRYWKTTDDNYVNNTAGLIKYVFEAEEYARLKANVASPLTETNEALIKPYANNYFEYDANQRVTLETAGAAGCSTCGTGQGSFKYSYSNNTTHSDPAGVQHNTWRRKTIEILPDTTDSTDDDNPRNIVYTNEIGAPMLSEFRVGSADSGSRWRTYYEYDGEGRLVMVAHPSAVDSTATSSTIEANADLVGKTSGTHPSSSAYSYITTSGSGLMEIYEYYGSGTTSDVDLYGFLREVSLRRNDDSGTAPVKQQTILYTSRDAGGAKTYHVDEATVYRNADGTGGQTTTYDYDWHGSTHQPKTITTSLPAVTAGQNGPGVAEPRDTFVAYFDTYGRTTWTKDGGGFINAFEYDLASGGLTKSIIDVNTSSVTGEPFEGVSGAWATPSGGGLHLVSETVVDSLGRTTKLTDPRGNVTRWKYNDAGHEVRVYRGWTSSGSTGSTVGPVEVYRTYYPAAYASSQSGERTLYYEALATTATPAADGSGNPTGTETIDKTNIVSLRRDLTNESGQIVASDGYFNVSGLTSYGRATGTLGSASNDSASGNYHRTQYAFDERGRLKRVTAPTGTRTWTLYDALGRQLSTWVGTNDDGATNGDPDGPGGNSNNMVKVAESQYDGGGVGDGNRTKATQLPGGASARNTLMYYDWRDRLVAVKYGDEGGTGEAETVQRQIVYLDFDNLSQVTARSAYDADTVTLSAANGVPTKPSVGRLHTYAESSYDEQGRVYQERSYNVTPGSTPTNYLAANYWYDRRGNTIKASEPGGLVTKSVFDGAGRLVKAYSTGGGGGSTWADAADVTSDKVLEQVETTYDAAGNPILITTRQRFHDEPAAGPLGNASTAPKARVSYAAAYYDAANRQTADVEFGTNGGTLDGTGSGADLDADNNGVADRPASVPTRSDTVLVTSYAFDGGGRLQDVTNPRGKATRYAYDVLGRQTSVIEDYGDGNPDTGSDDRTTAYTYGGLDQVLTMKALLPSSAFQTTEYVYGVTTGSDVASNDLLREVRYPNASTGSAGTTAADKNVYKYNALGQAKEMTDQNETVHAYSFDVLGRVVSDAVTLKSGNPRNLSSGVLRLGTEYDNAGRAFRFTSYNAASSGSVVNQVERGFNGFGQLTSEAQDDNSAVGSTSPRVRYTFSFDAAPATPKPNHSRLAQVFYPGGTAVNYSYGAEGSLNDAISRVEALTEGAVRLEEYGYLGLDTIVRQWREQPGTELTFLKQGSEADGNAGDRYTGLDRFGRVVDQRWRRTADGAEVDRFKYTYDRNSNRTGKDVQSAGVPDGNDEAYVYDDLDRLTSAQRGTYSGGSLTSQQWSQSWTLDTLGNWDYFNDDGTSNDQDRTHNARNQITGGAGGSIAYDYNGNMTTDEQGRTLVYDAWNRLVSSSGTTSVTYTYDALGRRVSEDYGSGNYKQLVYSDDWQVLEELNSSGVSQTTYVWGLGYVDALVLRDRVTSTGGAPANAFDGDGQLTTDFGAADYARGVAVQPDGKVVVAGTSGTKFAVARYNADGSLDTTFGGGDGKADSGSLLSGEGYTVALQADGKIVVAGGISATTADFGVVRFNADGTVDTSFGSSGLATADFGGHDYAQAVTVDAQGRIVAVGAAGSAFAVARFTAGGSLDTNFSSDGKLTTPFGGTTEIASGVLVQADGTIVVSGTTHSSSDSQVALARYEDDGSLDTDFSGDGKLVSAFLNATYGYRVALAAGPDGKLLVSGVNFGNFAIARYNADGTLDTTFGGGDGLATVNLSGTDYAYSLVVQADGNIVAGGTFFDSGYSGFALARFRVDGSLDTSFSGDGVLVTTFSEGNSQAFDVAVSADGRIYLAGQVLVTGTGDYKFAVAAYDGGRERLYAQQDANWNVTSITSVDGSVVERYLYDPYGKVTIKSDGAWTTRSSSDYGWRYLHQGGRHDTISGLYHFRNRDYSASLGRWSQQDPAGYIDGPSLYQYLVSSPVSHVDPIGLDAGAPRPGTGPRDGAPLAGPPSTQPSTQPTATTCPTTQPIFSGEVARELMRRPGEPGTSGDLNRNPANRPQTAGPDLTQLQCVPSRGSLGGFLRTPPTTNPTTRPAIDPDRDYGGNIRI